MTGDEVDRLFLEAEHKYQLALGIKPNMAEALNNRGNALLDYGATKTEEEADPVFPRQPKSTNPRSRFGRILHEFFRSGNIVLDERK